MTLKRYFYAPAHCDQIGEFADDRLERFTERHKLAIRIPHLRPTADPVRSGIGQRPDGMVLEMLYGWPRRVHLRAARRLLAAGIPVYFYWPNETAIERIDRERLSSYWRLWAAVQGIYRGSALKARLRPYYHLARSAVRRLRVPGHAPSHAPPIVMPETALHTDVAAGTFEEAKRIVANPRPVPPQPFDRREPGRIRARGTGVYLRTDFWARIHSGGSYGHTCYVAKALADASDGFVCFMASRFELLDELGVPQIVLDPPGQEATEANFLRATEHYALQLRAALQALRPAYVYERLCLGNYVAAKLCRELQIPYVVEYNGSEISMSKSFGGSGFVYENTYLKIEEAAFRQATSISVVSEPVREDLLRRGVAAAKILVNPNGVDVDAYAPATQPARSALRSELGFGAADRVVGFIGTFGGWHGVDILAAAIPRICERAPNARFLLIGDGSRKYLVDEQILKHKLGDRVRTVGSVAQREGARLLRACDIYVSPHNSHMKDSRFFGSPTKVFEYMALGGGIVASRLEQIGEVLSPALSASAVSGGASPNVTDERSLLCEPGNLREFIDGVVFLIGNPLVCERLGENARRAAAMQYTWDRHVVNLFQFLDRDPAQRAPSADPRGVPEPIASPNLILAETSVSGQLDASIATTLDARVERQIATGDAYKDEVQNQWDNNPCGSQYVKEASPHTLEWFLEAERYRYREYAPWMAKTMEFDRHAGKAVLEIGGGMGTDLAQFASHGAIVTDVDLSSGHLALARENFRLRGLDGTFIHHDAETLPLSNESFDLVYSNGVIHHTPNTQGVVDEIFRVLRPGGKAIIMVYAENSLHYWRNLVLHLGLRQGMLMQNSIGEVMSRSVEMTQNNARPLVKVYTKPRIRNLFSHFENVSVVQRQLTAPELPRGLSWLGLGAAGSLMGWNLIVKAIRPHGRA